MPKPIANIRSSEPPSAGVARTGSRCNSSVSPQIAEHSAPGWKALRCARCAQCCQRASPNRRMAASVLAGRRDRAALHLDEVADEASSRF